MRAMFIKDIYDVFGPWSSIRWEETHSTQLLTKFAYKPTLWEMTCILKADWYIINSGYDGWYTKYAALYSPERKRIFDKYVKNIFSIEDIPFEQYDLVICMNPIISPPDSRSTLFTYFLHEDCDPAFTKSIFRPIKGYDLFLNHMMSSHTKVITLPQSVAFPYMRDKDLVREAFKIQKDEAVYVDRRTVFSLGDICEWNDEIAKGILNSLEKELEMPVYCRGKIFKSQWHISDPPDWGDSIEYYRELGKYKYYIGALEGGPGQGLCDAASLGSICLGFENMPYHKLVCHPFCLCKNLQEAIHKLKEIRKSEDLQNEIVAFQDNMLEKIFKEKPLKILEMALEMKRNKRVNSVKNLFVSGVSLYHYQRYILHKIFHKFRRIFKKKE